MGARKEYGISTRNVEPVLAGNRQAAKREEKCVKEGMRDSLCCHFG